MNLYNMHISIINHVYQNANSTFKNNTSVCVYSCSHFLATERFKALLVAAAPWPVSLNSTEYLIVVLTNNNILNSYAAGLVKIQSLQLSNLRQVRPKVVTYRSGCS